jgi:hypothetical protein
MLAIAFLVTARAPKKHPIAYNRGFHKRITLL